MSEKKNNGKPQAGKAEHPAPASPATKTSATGLNLFALFLLLTTSAHSTQALIQPLFGYDFASQWFRLGTCISIALFSLAIPETENSYSNALKGVVVLQIVATSLSRTLGVYIEDAVKDPVLTATIVHGVTSFPIIGLGGAVWLNWVRILSAQEEATRAGELIMKTFSCFALSTCLWFAENVLGVLLSYAPNVHPKQIMAATAFLTLLLQINAQPSKPGSKPSSLTSPSLSSVALLSLLVASVAIGTPPYPNPLTNVLYSRFGGQGLVQVVDMEQTFKTLPMRYLRKDATIVGASYLVPIIDEKRNVVEPVKMDVGETMVRKALLLDGVRLVKGVKGKNAMVIGVGTGALTSQLVFHNYNTTLIESDREILSAARKYFKLREPTAALVEDAAVWFERNAPITATANAENDEEKPTQKFDIIVHDVVLGGVAPPHLFTMEFWESLKKALDEKGVLAVAYTGKPTTRTFKSILNMLLNNFGSCRVYHANALDAAPFSSPDSDSVTDFVIFCTPSSSLKFRSAGYSDYSFAGYPSRDRILRTFAQQEVPIASILGDTPRDRLLLKTVDPWLGKWGKDGALDVYKHMRETYPEEIWSNY